MTIETWKIYLVEPCIHTVPDPKPKFVIPVCIDDTPRKFLINSEIHEFYAFDLTLRACQVNILASEHPCLRYDSWVNCLELKPFDEPEASRRLMSPVSERAKREILAAVRVAPTLERKYQKLILKNQ